MTKGQRADELGELGDVQSLRCPTQRCGAEFAPQCDVWVIWVPNGPHPNCIVMTSKMSSACPSLSFQSSSPKKTKIEEYRRRYEALQLPTGFHQNADPSCLLLVYPLASCQQGHQHFDPWHAQGLARHGFGSKH